jgi:hypothetical protein
MRLAFLLVLALTCLGILARAVFSPIRPFGIVRAAAGLLPDVIRRQPMIVAVIFLPFLAAPLGSLVSRTLADHWAARIVVSLVWQGLCSGVLALAAVRLHRRVVANDRTNGILFGRRERRMAALVVLALVAIALVRTIPMASAIMMGTQGILQNILEAVAFLMSWAIVVLFAYVGPSASFDDASPFTVSGRASASEPVATMALVLIGQVLLGLVGLAMTSIVVLGQMNAALVIAVAMFAVMAMVLTFIVAELSMAIALTRIREGVYDDTRSREFNADWH